MSIRIVLLYTQEEFFQRLLNDVHARRTAMQERLAQQLDLERSLYRPFKAKPFDPAKLASPKTPTHKSTRTISPSSMARPTDNNMRASRTISSSRGSRSVTPNTQQDRDGVVSPARSGYASDGQRSQGSADGVTPRSGGGFAYW